MSDPTKQRMASASFTGNQPVESPQRQQTIFVAQRPAFGFFGQMLGFKHTAVSDGTSTVSLGNPASEPLGNYPDQFPVTLPQQQAQLVMANAERNKASYGGSKSSYFFDYMFRRGNCNDHVIDSLKQANVPVPWQMNNQSFKNNPEKSRELDKLRVSVVDSYPPEDVGAHLFADSLKIFTAPPKVEG